jgi:hypothetical protein
LFIGSMGYLINDMKSSCVLLNYGGIKSVCYRDGQNVRQQIHNKYYQKNSSLIKYDN